jgi:hypothetical protein
MHEHIAHLESELTAATDQLNDMESGARESAQYAKEAIEAGDYRRAHEAIVSDQATWELLDEEVGILKADIRVLRVLLAECRDWLETVNRTP